MKSISKWRRVTASVLSLLLCFGIMHPASISAASHSTPFILLSHDNLTLSIGEETYLTALTSDGKLPKFKSSNSKVATVNSWGRITAKKSGTCKITAKTTSAQASCKVKVQKTKITLETKRVSLERGDTFQLKAVTSNHTTPSFSSNRKSIAVVDSNGIITACKPGDAVITVKADGTKTTCRVNVKKPTISLTPVYFKLYRYQQVQLNANVSSGVTPAWSSNRSRVATVDEDGLVTAHKHGTALITAKVDGVSKICEIVVASPKITLGNRNLTLAVGERTTLDYGVSSGNAPLIQSSKPHVAEVDQLGNITAISPGTSVISFSEDGTRETCRVRVTD